MHEIPPLPSGAILLVEVGSTAHGTGLPGGEDRDELGVLMESPEEVLGLSESGMASVMRAPVLFTTEQGQGLRALAPHFVGRHVVPRYRGYMRQQSERLQGLRGHSGHGRRGSGGREELIQEFGFDTKYAMHCARLGFQCQELEALERDEALPPKPNRSAIEAWVVPAYFEYWQARPLNAGGPPGDGGPGGGADAQLARALVGGGLS